MTVLLDQGKENNRNKGEQMKSEWWRFLFPSYHVYIEELIHSQKWKVMGEKNTSFYLPLLSWFAMGGTVMYLISEFGWRNGTWVDEQTLLFFPNNLNTGCTLSLPPLCVGCFSLQEVHNWPFWCDYTQFWWKVLICPLCPKFKTTFQFIYING